MNRHYRGVLSSRPSPAGDVVTEYEFHPEAKCADAFGNPCDKQTIGLLQRRHIRIDLIKCIGKESNSLEHSEKNVYTEYSDPKRTEWITKIQPAIRKVELVALVKACGKRLSRREIIESGQEEAASKNQRIVRAILKKLGLI
jgi:hypothetical protein